MSSKSQKALSAGGLLVDLANLPDKGISQFREKWGGRYSRYSKEEILMRRDELRLLWTHRHWSYPGLSLQEEAESNESWYVEHPEAVRPDVPTRARRLYSEWEDTLRDAGSRWGPPGLEAEICGHWLKLEPEWWHVIWQKNQRTIGWRPACLPGMLAGTCLRAFEDLGVCRNPKCAAPYFFLQRSDQLYCSTECAKPARRASKLKWWRERRGRKTRGGVAFTL